MSDRPIFVVALVAASCNAVTVQTPTRSLDRPSDVSLVCATWIQLPDETAPRLHTLPLTSDTGRPPCDVPDPNQIGAPPNPNAVLTDVTGNPHTPQLFVLSSNTSRGELALNTMEPGGCDPGATPPTTCSPGIGCDENNRLCNAILNQLSYEGAQIIDLDHQAPGYGFVPIGNLPQHLRATDDGCAAVAANAEGCDLSVVDMYGLLAVQVGDRPQPQFLTSLVRHVTPHVSLPGGGRRDLFARPTWIELSPSTTDLGLRAHGSVLAADEASCGAAHYRAMVAFPACELVAEIDLATGELTQAVRVTRDGASVVSDLSAISCPVECAGVPAPAPPDLGGPIAAVPPDAATPPSDGGGPIDAAVPAAGAVVADGGGADGEAASAGTPPLVPAAQGYPATFALTADGAARTLIVGDAASDRLTLVALGDADRFGAVSALALAPRTDGVLVVRASPRLDFGGGRTIRYLYAAARDRSVRVVDLDELRECETNPDPRIINSLFPIADASGAVKNAPADVAWSLRCVEIGDPTQPRAPWALGPGIALPGGSLPADVAFVHPPVPVPDPVNGGPEANPRLLVGDFAWIVDSSGHADAVNLNDQCPQPNITTPPSGVTLDTGCIPANFAPSVSLAAANLAHPIPVAMDFAPNQIRSATTRFDTPSGPADPIGAPRLPDLPTETVLGVSVDLTNGDVFGLCNVPGAGASGGADGGVPAGGQGFGACAPAPAAIEVNGAYAVGGLVSFPDPSTVRSENWTLSWEGPLDAWRLAPTATGSVVGSTLRDPSGVFCKNDVRGRDLAAGNAGDKLYLIGCVDDTGCGPEQQCYIDPSALDPVHGMCVPRDPAGFLRAQNDCKPWLQAIRRYRVARATSDALSLEEIDEPENLIDAVECATDADCAGVTVPSPFDTVSGTALPTQCLDSGAGVRRCLRACSTTAKDTGSLCGPGFMCQPSALGDERCMRAKLPPADETLVAECFPGLEPYEVHAGDAFAVHGDVTVLSTPEAVGPAGECVAAPLQNPGTRLLAPRIPMPLSRDPAKDGLPDCGLPDPTTWLGPLPPGDAATANTCRLLPANDDGSRIYLRYQNPALITVLQVPVRELASGGVQIFDGGVGDGGAVDGGVSPATTARSEVPGEATVLIFPVVGGFLPLVGTLGTDVLAQEPRAAQVAPDKISVFVVDEGRQSIATGLRGQIIRFLTGLQTSDPQFLIR